MNKYAVEITRKYTIIVEAENAPEARIVVSEDPETDTQQEALDAKITQALPEARAETYICHWCKAPSLKKLWGPGRITCPRCKKVAPSAAEFHAMGG